MLKSRKELRSQTHFMRAFGTIFRNTEEDTTSKSYVLLVNMVGYITVVSR